MQHVLLSVQTLCGANKQEKTEHREDAHNARITLTHIKANHFQIESIPTTNTIIVTMREQ